MASLVKAYPYHIAGSSSSPATNSGFTVPFPLSSPKFGRTKMMRSARIGLLGLAAGIIVGFVVCLWAMPLPCLTSSECCLRAQLNKQLRLHNNQEHKSSPESEPGPTSPRKQVLIGVMTAAAYIDTRAKTLYETWASSINGDVIFFSSESTPQRADLPVVPLPGVDDAYPPQKKSFMLLKYLHDFGIDRYDYFMRVDDDVYIHGGRLGDFLSKLNSSQTLFIGQAGLGNKEEFGRLSLGRGENFCMGGPGMIFSGPTLRKMVPHIAYCLQHLKTTHEDVEVGRCVRMFAGVQCTWNYEAQKVFYNSYAPKTDILSDISKQAIGEAITIHALKSTEAMLQTHLLVSARELAKQEAKLTQLQSELDDLDSLLNDKPSMPGHTVQPLNRSDLLTWTYITKKHQYEHSSFSVKRNLYVQRRLLLNESLLYIKHELNEELSAQNLVLDGLHISDINYGYERYHPINGIEQILSLDLRLRRLRGRTPARVETRTIRLRRPYAATYIQEAATQTDDVTIHFILPLSGRLQIFERFLHQFETVCGQSRANCNLLVMLHTSDESQQTMQHIQRSRCAHSISVINTSDEFSRAHALHLGMSSLAEDSLVLFIDVDIYFTYDSLQRVRQHTKQGQQVYFPIVFSQYDSKMVCNSDICPVDKLSTDTGAFRFFGFGIVSLFKSDYTACGGFDLSIHGWGKEDVDLYTKIIRSRTVNVFRAADPSFVHIYHPVVCEASLNRDQATMCLNSKAASFASKRTLSQLYS